MAGICSCGHAVTDHGSYSGGCLHSYCHCAKSRWEVASATEDKAVLDARRQFSQVDMDTATKPLHAEIERLGGKNARLKAALDRTRCYIETAMYSGGVRAICAEGIYERAHRSGLQHALNALNSEFMSIEEQ